ncbi:helicase POLQ-like [Nilaparvata lugens]|uniref:helicase POLQ-like n=1 Tax=Nilaparvata lugens TaxID=108931 RepID=UPI00193DA918|nr:helicase POLQ-like [Nilaparvata lugens]
MEDDIFEEFDMDFTLPSEVSSTPLCSGLKRPISGLTCSPILSVATSSKIRKHLKLDDEIVTTSNNNLGDTDSEPKSKDLDKPELNLLNWDDDSVLNQVDLICGKVVENGRLESGNVSPSPDLFEEEGSDSDHACDMSVDVSNYKDSSPTEDLATVEAEYHMSVDVGSNSKTVASTNQATSIGKTEHNHTNHWPDDSAINWSQQHQDILNKSTDRKNDSDVCFGDRLKNILLNNALKPCKIIASTPVSSKVLSNPSDANSFYGLPLIVKTLIKRYKGINQLYDWQIECLKLPAIANKKNLMYALPTSGGKTLVAEILMLRTILCEEKDVLLVLPYVSIVQEKVRSLSPFAVEMGFLIEEYAGAKGVYPPLKRRRKHTIFIATIEKSLGLVHSYIETNRISELGLVVVDELHIIGEPRRGASLEAMLTKLMVSTKAVHIIGMSATIGNINEVAAFLKADVYTHNFRPVELKEFIKVEDEVFVVKMNEDPPLKFHSKLIFSYTPEMKQIDPDEIGGLVSQVAPEESCLVFCPSKKNCENVALLICRTMKRQILTYKQKEKGALFQALKSEGNGSVCPTLCKTLPYGVAYHNSGLTNAERKLIEEAFCAKTIFCICCTSTLAAGVNLPAKRVILRSPYIGTEFINLSRYKQMVGRAGRAGISNGCGESFLLCKPCDTLKIGELLHSPMDICKSQLRDPEPFNSFLLSVVGLNICSSKKSMKQLMESTLLFTQNLGESERDALVEETVAKLLETGALHVKKCDDEEDILSLSTRGRAAMRGTFDMETANRVFEDLQLAKKSLVVTNHLHLIFLITPYAMMETIKFEQKPFTSKFMSLNSDAIQVAMVLGIDERCVAQMMCGRKPKAELLPVLHRFYLSLVLFDLWEEKSVWEVSDSFQLSRGVISTLLNSAVAFASSVLRFCEELEEMWCFRRVLVEITNRLSHCCTPELIALMELPSVKIGRARQLYNSGFKTISTIANTEPKTLAKVIDHLPWKVAHQIVAAAKLKLMTTVETLQEEAETVLAFLQNKVPQ